MSNLVRTGISYSQNSGPLVPLYEEREAARFALYNWMEWVELDPTERATCVAHYRLSGMIKMHSDDAVTRASKRNNPTNDQRWQT